MDLWNSANKDPRKRTRMAIKAGIQDVLRCTVQKGANVHLPMHQEAGHAGAAAEALLPDWRIVKGSACTNFAHAEDMVYRRNIILQEQDGTVLLQRLGGIYSHRNLASMRAEVQTGFQLFQTVLAGAKLHSTPHRDSSAEYHFGIWTATGHATPCITQDTRQDSKPAARKPVMDFCLWMRHYVDQFVAPLLHKRYGMAEEILAAYHKRQESYEWLQNQAHGDLARLVCHPMYSTFSPFNAYTSTPHTDRNDADYTFLLNFGAKCYLELPQYKLQVDLQPFDVVFFQSNTLLHRTLAHPGEQHPDARWAVSGYLRKNIARQAAAHPLKASTLLVEQAMRSQKDLGYL